MVAGGSAGGRRHDREHRQTWLGERRLGEQTAIGLVAVGEEHERRLLALRAERAPP